MYSKCTPQPALTSGEDVKNLVKSAYEKSNVALNRSRHCLVASSKFCHEKDVRLLWCSTLKCVWFLFINLPINCEVLKVRKIQSTEVEQIVSHNLKNSRLTFRELGTSVLRVPRREHAQCMRIPVYAAVTSMASKIITFYPEVVSQI